METMSASAIGMRAVLFTCILILMTGLLPGLQYSHAVKGSLSLIALKENTEVTLIMPALVPLLQALISLALHLVLNLLLVLLLISSMP